MARPTSPDPPTRWRAWTLLALACAGVAGAVDAYLLGRVRTYFTSGPGVYVEGAGQLLGFFGSGLLLDLWLVFGVWACAWPLLRRLPLSPLQRFGLAGLLGAAVPLTVDWIRFNLQTILGGRIRFAFLWEVSNRSVSELIAHAMDHVPPPAVSAVALIAAGALLLFVARRIERRIGLGPDAMPPPTTGRLWAVTLALGAVGAGILLLPGAAAERVQYGLVRKPSGIAMVQLVQGLSDVDRDGFGVFSRPPDPAPTDGSIHPFALDHAGNAIDENGMAGDHPIDFEGALPISAPPPDGPRRPHFLLVFLESFRADLIEADYEGRPVTPVLRGLAAEGAHARHAYVHCPYTVASRAQLFGGTLVHERGEPTLIDDFAALGYRVAYFSGQDDAFGRGDESVGLERADVAFTARDAVDRRTSRSQSQGLLQVSGAVVLEQVEAFLAGHDPDVPLFLYVNLVDAHYPYDHREMDDLLGVDPIAVDAISADRADAVWRTYLNSAANVDRDVGRLLALWRAHLGERDDAVLVTADHGESIYDDGMLGHAQSLDASVTRIPLVIRGIPGEWPEPLGLADVRGLLRRHLFSPLPADGARPRARFVPDPERRVLQWMARIHKPKLIGLRGLDGAVLFDLGQDRVEIVEDAGTRRVQSAGDGGAGFESLVREWEAARLRLESEAAEAGPGGRG